MTTTTNYGFNIVEGTDIVNPLTQLNPNFTALDSDLKAVSDQAVDNATCVKTGSVHAITRNEADRDIIKFTATGNWNTGDTMTVDGVSVSVYLPNGEAPLTGAFVINTEVLVILNGTRATLYASPNKATYTAAEINMSNGDSIQDNVDKIGSIVTVFSGQSYTANSTWVIPQALQDVIDAGIPFIVEADFYFGDTLSSSRITKVTTIGLGGHVSLTLDRTEPQTGLVRIAASTFDAFGFDLAHAPKLTNLYVFPMAAY